MDDDDEEYNYGSDADEYNYSDQEEEGNDELIEIENYYYEGDDCRAEDPAKAVEMFEKVVALESERSEVKWRFKALEHLAVLQFRLNRHERAVERYKEMLSYATTVTRNECGDSVNAVLDAISAENSSTDLLAQISKVTTEALLAAKNDRLWFSSNVKVGKLYLQRKDFEKVKTIVESLRQACTDGRDDDASRGTALLEVYALEIQLCAAVGDGDRLKQIYPKTLNLNAAVADPRIMGVIREEGGKMHMSDGEWKKAYNEFYEGFRAYQEAGNVRAKDCLKYVVLANMLMTSDINPFDAREAKAYQEEPEITAMKGLRLSYDANDLHAFERTLHDTRNKILDDPFIMTYVDPLRRKMREQVLLNLVKPYARLTLQFVADQLNLKVNDVHDILVDMILDDRIHGKIDQLSLCLQLKPPSGVGAGGDPRAHALSKWSTALDHLALSAATRVS
mmetsp:Transcript_12339/g.40338  ORF Transcript_12339/g.40338 Transcript_12339/m.40338 type:complete len:450 (+) Transcript_12339:88-1437(+)